MFLELTQNRRSIRKYLDKPIPSEKVNSIVEALLRAPTSRGKNSWEFVVVNDPGLLEKLSRSKPHGASFLKNAALGIVVCGNPRISDVWVEDASIASIFIHLSGQISSQQKPPIQNFGQNTILFGFLLSQAAHHPKVEFVMIICLHKLKI